MKLINSVKLGLEEFEKISLICDVDCPLGQLYDFSCALQSFVLNKMKESEAKPQPPVQNPVNQEEVKE